MPLALKKLVTLGRVAHRFHLTSLKLTDCWGLICAEKYLLEHVNFFGETLLGYSFDELNRPMRAHDVLKESVISFLSVLRLSMQVGNTLLLLWVFK